MADRRGLEFEGAATPAEAAEILLRLAEGIRARAVSLAVGEEALTVCPDGDLSLEIEAREKKDRARVELSISWKRAPGPDHHDGEGDD